MAVNASDLDGCRLNLISARINLGLSQRKAAVRMCMNKSELHLMEHGKIEITDEMLEKFGKIYCVKDYWKLDDIFIYGSKSGIDTLSSVNNIITIRRNGEDIECHVRQQ